MPFLVEQYFADRLDTLVLTLSILFLIGFAMRKWTGSVLFPGVLALLRHIAFGSAIGFAGPSIALLITWAAGDAVFIGFMQSDAGSFGESLGWGWLAIFLFVAALFEEVIMRGVYLIIPYSIGIAIFDLSIRQRYKLDSMESNDLHNRYPGFNEPAKTNQPKAPPCIPKYPFGNLRLEGSQLRRSFAAILLAALILAQSAYFAYAHLGNPSVTPLALANIGLAGVFFGMLVYFGGSFYTAVFAHFVWNYTYEIFDLPVSGYIFETGNKIFTFALKDAGLIGGGAFGLEGGVAMTAVLIAGITMMPMINVKKRGLGPISA